MTHTPEQAQKALLLGTQKRIAILEKNLEIFYRSLEQTEESRPRNQNIEYRYHCVMGIHYTRTELGELMELAEQLTGNIHAAELREANEEARNPYR